MKEGLGVAVGVLTLLSRSEARAKAAERAAARDASVSFRVAMAATHPRCCSRRFNFKEPSFYLKSTTLHTQDIHWIDDEAR